jgi:hypothetical protein
LFRFCDKFRFNELLELKKGGIIIPSLFEIPKNGLLKSFLTVLFSKLFVLLVFKVLLIEELLFISFVNKVENKFELLNVETCINFK